MLCRPVHEGRAVTQVFTGVVLWFRPTSGQGMVRGDDGKQFFFRAAQAAEIHPEAGLQVRFELTSPGDGPVEAVALRLAGERRVVSPPVGARPTRAGKGAPTRKQRQAARRASGGPERPARKLAMAEGTTVNHPVWGPGHVFAATEKLVSVEFYSGVRMSFKPSALQDLSGPDVPKAPRRRKRAPKKTEEPRSGGRRVVRRRKDGGD